MLLIINFLHQPQALEPAHEWAAAAFAFLTLASRIAHQLGENETDTFTISLPVPLPLVPAAAASPLPFGPDLAALAKDNADELDLDLVQEDYNRMAESLLYLAGLHGHGLTTPAPTLSGLGSYPPNANANANVKPVTLTRLKLKSNGLAIDTNTNTDEGESEGNGGGEWDWQDRGPVVIIPPTHDPALALFLGHAITHYLSDGDIWSSLYVVTNHQPLRLMEWD